MREDVLPYRSMRVVDDAVATLSRQCRLVRPLSAVSGATASVKMVVLREIL